MSQISEVQDQLNRLLDLAHHQVHFAEAKNGALLTLNFAMIAAMVAISGEQLQWQWRVYMFSVGLMLGSAGIIAFVSFLPRMTPIRDRNLRSDGNVAFTGDIALMGSATFLRLLSSKMAATEELTPYCIDLADQIYVNSRIAETKFRRFRVASWLTVSALVLPTLWLLYQVLSCSLKIGG